MWRRFAITLLLLLSVLSWASPSPTLTKGELTNRLNGLQIELLRVSSSIKNYENKIANSLMKIQELSTSLTSSEQEIANLQMRLLDSELRIENLELQLQDYEKKIEELRVSLQKSLEDLEKQQEGLKKQQEIYKDLMSQLNSLKKTLAFYRSATYILGGTTILLTVVLILK